VNRTKVDFKTMASLHFASSAPTTGMRKNRFEFRNGVLWIRAESFQLNPQQIQEFDELLKEMSQLRNVKHIVFDARRNTGGNSYFGQKIFDTVTGGLEFDDTPGLNQTFTYAQWRVSDVAIQELQERVARAKKNFGENHANFVWVNKLLDNMTTAKTNGLEWVEQKAGPYFSRDELKARGARLKNFGGPISLITDANCASACLDFADLVLKTPGAVHLGEKTSSDSSYIDVTFYTLKSGNGFLLPLKVWRNRLRGNNEALTPSIPIEASQADGVIKKLIGWD
jgi:hypothetical protein